MCKKYRFSTQDKITGTSILETLAFLKKSQYWDKQIREYQLKTKNLIDYSIKMSLLCKLFRKNKTDINKQWYI